MPIKSANEKNIKVFSLGSIVASWWRKSQLKVSYLRERS